MTDDVFDEDFDWENAEFSFTDEGMMAVMSNNICRTAMRAAESLGVPPEGATYIGQMVYFALTHEALMKTGKLPE